jgi:four helix bundle protein
MRSDDHHRAVWEQKQAELWDRIFQVSSEVVDLTRNMEDDEGGEVVSSELVKSAMRIGAFLVRANAAEKQLTFTELVVEARMQAIETDYWLRMLYVLQQKADVQRDLSSVITQYASIIDMLDRLVAHVKGEPSAVKKHTRRTKVVG